MSAASIPSPCSAALFQPSKPKISPAKMSGGFPPNSVSNDRFMSCYGRSRKQPPKEAWAETLGFESMNLESAEAFATDPAPATAIGGRSATDRRRTMRNQLLKEKAEKDHELKIFPPFLTTLNCNGRPRFSFTRECTGDGRIQMHMAQSERKEILRCFRGDGRLTMVLAGSDDDEDSDDDTGDEESATLQAAFSGEEKAEIVDCRAS